MPEREHFTNGRTFTFGTGLTLMLAAFGAQNSGWHHYIAIGIAYGSGLTSMLGAIVLISRSYYGRHEHYISPNPSSTAIESVPRVTPELEVLSPLQFDALRIAKNIDLLLAKFPDAKMSDYKGFNPTRSPNGNFENIKDFNPWMVASMAIAEKLKASFALNVKSDLDSLYLRFVEVGVVTGILNQQ